MKNVTSKTDWIGLGKKKNIKSKSIVSIGTQSN